MNRVLRWGSVLVYAAVLTILLVMPLRPAFRPLFPHADKVEHFFALGLLGVLLLRAMTDPRADKPANLAWVLAILVSIAYAVAMEFVQGRVGRDCSFCDMLAGALGSVVMTTLWVKLRTRSVFLR